MTRFGNTPRIPIYLFLGLFVISIISSVAHGETNSGSLNPTLDALDANYYEKTLRVLAGDLPLPGARGPGPVKLQDRSSYKNIKLAREYLVDQIKQLGFGEPNREEFEVSVGYGGGYGGFGSGLGGGFFKGTEKGSGARVKSVKGVNYYFEIKGTEKPNEIVTVGAHYDTIHEDVPGANDNGTGVTAVLAMAKAFKEKGLAPKRTIRFVLFDKEEPPFSRDGSDAFFEKRLLSPREKNVLFINIDMIGYSPHGMKNAGYSGEMFPAAQTLLKEATVKAGLPDLELTSFDPFISDNLAATFRGIPAVAICEDARDKKGNFIDDPNNHEESDQVKNINFNYAMRLLRWTTAATMMASDSNASFATKESQQIQLMARSAAKMKSDGSSSLAQRVADMLESHCMRELEKLGRSDDEYSPGGHYEDYFR